MLYIVLVQWPFVPTGKLVQKGTDGGIPCRLIIYYWQASSVWGGVSQIVVQKQPSRIIFEIRLAIWRPINWKPSGFLLKQMHLLRGPKHIPCVYKQFSNELQPSSTSTATCSVH